MIRLVFMQVLVLTFLGITASCGIDTIVYLSNDPTLRSSDASALVFSGPDSGDASYLGVEIFYRIYASASDADADRGNVVSRQTATNAVPGSIVESYLANSSGLNYHKPVLKDTAGIPTVRIPAIRSTELPSVAYYASIDFPSASNTEPTITIVNGDTSVSTGYTLMRNVSDSAGVYRTFRDEPRSGDSDYRSNSSDTDGEYFVQFFATSYGLDFFDFTELFGDAVYLGRITLNF